MLLHAFMNLLVKAVGNLKQPLMFSWSFLNLDKKL